MTISKSVHGAGADIVVIHGWGMNSNVWQTLIPELSDSFRVTSIDLPGFGDSNDQQLADSVAAVCERLLPELPESFHILGWSMGGLIATELALTQQQRVLSLATVGSSPFFIEESSWPGIKASLMQQFYQQLDRDFGKTIERFMAVQAMGSPYAKALIKQVREWVFAKPMANPKSLLAGLKLLEETDFRTKLGEINQPFIRFYGRLDSLVPAAAINLIDELAPDSECEVFPHCAHMPFISQTHDFATRYRRFLSAV